MMPYGFNDDKSKFDLGDLQNFVSNNTEATDTATRHYASDAYVFVKDNSTLYCVDSYITDGDSISENAHPVTITSELVHIISMLGDPSVMAYINEDTAANIVSPGVNCSIAGAVYRQWGKVAQIYIGITCNADIAQDDVIAVLVDGKQPVLTTALVNTYSMANACAAYSDCNIRTKTPIQADTTIHVIGTYIVP